MTQVLVLTAPGPLGAGTVEAARLGLEKSAKPSRAPRRLAEAAVEIGFDGAAGPALEAVRTALAGEAVDANVVPAENRAKKILICDMDSTVIGVECIDEIADFAGVKAEVSGITERAMRGELDFEEALRARVALLKGLPVDVLAETYATRVRLNGGAEEMATTMRDAGALTALVSGGFDYFTERVAAAAGFQRNQANRLLTEDGRLTGEPGAPILGRQAKLDALMRFCAELECRPEDAVAVGDGANDLAMIGAAGLGVAYRAKPAVAAEADARLDHSHLDAVLRLQGIPAKGFNL